MMRKLVFFFLISSFSFAQVGFANTILSVPFKAQVPPGSWAQTKNCGQACLVMVFSYYNGTIPRVDDIKQIDEWLRERYGDPINGYNGSVTNTAKLEAAAKEYGGFTRSYKDSGWNLERLKRELDAGHPVIVAVIAGKLPNRGYEWAGGHFVVAIGYDEKYIICNDPGTSWGNRKYYLQDHFHAAMTAQGGAVVVVLPTTASKQAALVMYVHEGNQYGPVIVGAQVKGHDGAGTSFNKITNQSGYVTITGTAGTWHFEVSKAGYRTEAWDQNITQDCTRHAFLQPGQPVELIANGSFSQGSTGWAVYGSFWVGTNLPNCRTCPGYAAGGADVSGRPINNAVGWMYQIVTIPSDVSTATLVFWYNISSEETTTSPCDILNVTIQDSSGRYLATVAVLSNADKTSLGNYRQMTFDLTPYRGRTIRISFSVTTDEKAHTVFRIDDVNILVD